MNEPQNQRCGIKRYFFMPQEVKDRYSTVQIRSFLGRRLRLQSVVLGIPKRVNEVQVAECVHGAEGREKQQ